MDFCISWFFHVFHEFSKYPKSKEKHDFSKYILKPMKYQQFYLPGLRQGSPKSSKITPGAPRTIPGCPRGLQGRPEDPQGRPRDPLGTPKDSQDSKRLY